MPTSLSVTAADVIRHLPIDASQITATTVPLSTVDIDVFIQDGTSEIMGIVGKDGVELADLTGDALVQVQAAVKAYAVAESLDAIGVRGSEYDKWRRKWEDIRDRYADRPALVAVNRNRVFSTVQEGRLNDDFNDPTYRF
jgi:hypothetical protein